MGLVLHGQNLIFPNSGQWSDISGTEEPFSLLGQIFISPVFQKIVYDGNIIISVQHKVIFEMNIVGGISTVFHIYVV